MEKYDRESDIFIDDSDSISNQSSSSSKRSLDANDKKSLSPRKLSFDDDDVNEESDVISVESVPLSSSTRKEVDFESEEKVALIKKQQPRVRIAASNTKPSTSKATIKKPTATKTTTVQSKTIKQATTSTTRKAKAPAAPRKNKNVSVAGGVVESEGQSKKTRVVKKGIKEEKISTVKPLTTKKAKETDKAIMIESSSHSTKDMVITALGALKENKGSTIAGIRNYIKNNLNPTERRLKSVTTIVVRGAKEGWLNQVVGTNAAANSRFKLQAKNNKAKTAIQAIQVPKKMPKMKPTSAMKSTATAAKSKDSSKPAKRKLGDKAAKENTSPNKKVKAAAAAVPKKIAKKA